jgi:FG-GAP repeat
MRIAAASLAFPCVCLSLLGAAACSHPARVAGGTPPTATDGNWLGRARQFIALREYRVGENGHGLQAPNRAHDLRTYFAKSGVRLHDRAGGGGELLRLSLARVGRGATLSAVAPGEQITARENRVEISRPGSIEWYENSPAGLEQGFTFADRPPGEGPLVLELALVGARASLRGDALVFETPSHRKLHYGQLLVSDASGHMMVARFDLPKPDRPRIVVEDAGATYPLVIDPLFTATADTQLDASDSDISFGISVAGAGDVNGDGYDDVIVGAELFDAGQTDEGAAFVFLGSASGIADGSSATAAASSNRIRRTCSWAGAWRAPAT